MVTIHKSSKKLLIFLGILILGLGIALTLYQLQQQQLLKQFAAQNNQSATTSCSTDTNIGTIAVSFANSDPDKDIKVSAKDLQTGQTVDLGTIAHGTAKEGKIMTDKVSLDAGDVIFTITWADGTLGTDTNAASYKAIGPCNQTTVPVAACVENQAFCRWDPLEGAVSYDVTVRDADSKEIVKHQTLPQTASQSAFIMESNKNYECIVTPQNACGVGTEGTAAQKSCVLPTPTPTLSISPTATPSPTLEVTATPIVSPTPTTPSSTPTTVPTATPTSLPTPTSPPNPTVGPTTPIFPSNTPQPTNRQQTNVVAANTSQPTIAPSGNTNPLTLFAILSVGLSVIGLLLFFAL